MVALHCGQRIHSPSGTPRFGLPAVAMASRLSFGIVAIVMLESISTEGAGYVKGNCRGAGVSPAEPQCRRAACTTLFVVDLRQRREGRALDVLQKRPAAGGDVCHLRVESELLDRLRR